MRSLFARLADIRACPDCQIVPTVTRHGDRYNDVRVCAPCDAKERVRTARLDAMTQEEFIREVVNDRAEVGDSKRHSQGLYERYWQDMPYGTAKARDGDPHQWIANQLLEDYGHLVEEEVT